MTADTTALIKRQSERRRYRRHPAIELNAEIRIKKGLFSEWLEVEPCDYSKLGISIESEHDLTIGQQVTLNITLKMLMGDIHIAKAEGVVKNKMESHPHPRYGIEFDYNATRHMKNIETKSQLGRIEGILERSEKLRLKTEVQPTP